MRPFIVSVYMVDRGYGGPEEGGWWYDRGELVRLVRIFNNEESAYAYARKLNDRLDSTLNRGRRVLSEGRYAAKVHEGIPPKYYPEARPYYE